MEHLVSGLREIAQAAATARHQTPRCSLPASPLRQSGQIPNALWLASQSNLAMQMGVLLAMSTTVPSGSEPV
eukprot:2734052-Heterocapsa_arctica.AAC.1